MKLTKAEEQIMHILWVLEEGTVQDVLKGFKESKPARTTVATVLSVLENKGFVQHYTRGHVNVYLPLISKEHYSKNQMKGFLKDYFNGSVSAMFSLFAKESDMSLEDMDRIMEDVKSSLEPEKERA